MERKPPTIFAILGQHPTLSAAEWLGRFGPGTPLRLIGSVAMVSLTIDRWSETLDGLGGTIKLGRILQSWDATPTDATLVTMMVDVLRQRPAEETRRMNFGISSYAAGRLDARHLGMDVKSALREAGISARLVTGREKQLSSVIVGENQLLERGAEFVLIGDGKTVHLGQTMAVQDYKAYGQRDYGRPARDARSGMLPPKLAQMMINLAWSGESATLLDPFCGSGTVLQEAALMGIDRLIGSDAKAGAIDGTKQNLTSLDLGEAAALHISDIRQVPNIVNARSVDMIVTEPDLGPPIGAGGQVDLSRIVRDLTKIYEAAFQSFAKVLKPGSKVCMVWPFWRLGGSANSYLDLWPAARKAGFSPVTFNLGEHELNPAPRHSFEYFRPDQRVGREIVVMRKAK